MTIRDTGGLMKRTLIIFLMLLAMAFPALSQAAGEGGERILDYAVTARVEEDASLVVTERITVSIEHKAIIHGIYRIYPVKIRENGDVLRHYGFEVLSAKLDGKDTPYSVTEEGYTAGVAMGDPESKAPRGSHTYELTYRTTGHVRFLPARDEIYYNVTGNFWKFPIEHVSFTLELPGGASPEAVTAFTGALGAKGAEYRMTGPTSLETTGALSPGEGITVAVGWKKGIVTEPEKNLSDFMGDNRALTLSAIPLFQLLLFLLLRLLWTHRRRGVAYPLFHAPEGMSPGAVACLKNRSYPAALIQADILWAAVNGFLRMRLSDKETITLVRTAPAPRRRRPLPEWCAALLRGIQSALFPYGKESVIDLRSAKEGRDRDTITRSYLNLKKKYEKKLKGAWTETRLPGIISTAAGLGLFWFAMNCGIYYPGLNFDPPLTASQMLFFVGGFAGLCMLFAYGFRKTRAVFSGVRRIAGMVLSVGMIFLLALLLFFLLDFDLAFFAGSALVMCTAVWSLYRPCARLSDRGDRMDTEMRGLEMYIRTAEKHRLAKINAPEDTVEKYEELLPYAAALNCAEAWQKRFDPLLARLNYVPDWIDEPGTQEVFTPKRVSRIIRTVAGPSAMTRAVSAGAAAYAAATSGYAGSGSTSSSSSGFSGGSSGGGSGGGGGGGW